MKTKLNSPSRCGLLLGGAMLSAAAPAAAQQQPNIVFILADDLGYGDLSCYGQQRFSTPNIDSLAASGLRFTQCYAGTTVSAPSRSCLLTGLHSGHTAVRGNLELQPEGQYPLPEDSAVMFGALKAAGYTVGVFGKWGLGFIGTTGDPMRQGVDRFYGYNCQLLAHSYYPDHLWDNSQRVELDTSGPYGSGAYAPDLIHAQALEFIDECADRPFMLFYPTTIPHAELIVPEDDIIEQLRGRYPETPYRGVDSGPAFRHGGYCSQEYPRATFAAMVTRLDRYVGELVARLRERGVLENTVIIFSSDNGPHMEGGADPDFFDSNGPLRGYKRDLYEGGIRVPMIFAGCGITASGTCDRICTFWDLPSTFAEIAGTSLDDEGDGHSIVPLLEGRDQEYRESDYLYFSFSELGGREAVREGDWKLLHLNIRSDNPQYELYNLADDPGETADVIEANPEKAEHLRSLMRQAWVDDPAWPIFRR